ncbi:MAG: hypothetical protein IID16_00785 [Candidatus Marinimicrobia bacterium]|nr:hypothetical protein [Candidatus Neomarinimicrobiota bacterium]
MKNLREEIEEIPVKDFYCGGSVNVELEVYGDEIYKISLSIEEVRDEYDKYAFPCIREYDNWGEDKKWIKAYFLTHLDYIKIDNG